MATEDTQAYLEKLKVDPTAMVVHLARIHEMLVDTGRNLDAQAIRILIQSYKLEAR